LKEEPYLKFFFSKPPALGNHAAILFDRDGVINERVVGGYVTEWKQFRFRDGIIQAMTALAKLALPMVVVSNQAGVGKCLLSSRALEDITERFVSELKECHVRIDAVLLLPAHTRAVLRLSKTTFGINGSGCPRLEA
jgi:HAD superfamily hydrolase (TIGR01662 family)